MAKPLELARISARLSLLVSMTQISIARLRRSGGQPRAAVALGQRWASQLIHSLGVAVDVTGAPPDRTVLLVANHRSYMDVPLILAQQPCAFLAKAEIARWPMFGPAATLNHTVYVQRDDPTSRRASVDRALRLLRGGVCFTAFPEGTTSIGPGMGPFFPGLFRMAAENGIPVVPVAIHYADPLDGWVSEESFMGHFLRQFRKPSIHGRVAFGPLWKGSDADELRLRTHDWIRTQLAHWDGAETESTPALLGS